MSAKKVVIDYYNSRLCHSCQVLATSYEYMFSYYYDDDYMFNWLIPKLEYMVSTCEYRLDEGSDGE